MFYISSYSFGKIIIDGHEYNSDLIIFPNKIKNNWWRDKGHLLQKNDLQSVIKYNPQKVIIGTGKFSKMKVPKNLIEELKRKAINIEIYKTDKAIHKYNNSNKEETICALHLSC